MSQSTISKIAVGVLTIVGIGCLIAGIVLHQKFPEMAKEMIEESLMLSENSESAELWADNPVPLYWTVTFFNITNPDETRLNQKPNLEEVGPFKFREVKKKTDIDWRTDNGTVFYKDHRQYIYDSGLDLQTEITHFNALYLAIVENMLEKEVFGKPITPAMVGLILKSVFKKKPNITLVETHTAWDILFGGYESDLITELSTNPLAAQDIKKKFPDLIFGLYYNKNDTAQHSFEVNTGRNDVEDVGKIMQYDNKTSMENTWGTVNDTHCNMINGTDGTMFGPGVTKDKRLYVFQSELCRSASLRFEEEVAVQDIVAYKFVLPDDVLQDKFSNPDNECFCAKDYCKTGTIKISIACPEGTGGIVLSAPHFYYGDASLYDGVDGMKPEAKRHETYLSVEPNTGIVIKAAKRLQINVHVRNLSLPLLDGAEERVVPIAWMEESAEIDAKSADTLKSKAINKLIMYPKLLIALAAVGGFFILLGGIICIYKRR